MFREIITSSITLANSGTVIGGNIAPAVSGLTVYGDVSASGTIYSKLLIINGVSATGSALSSALVAFPTPDTTPGLKIDDVLKYQETTPGVSAWTSGRVFVEELSASGTLKEGALVTYSEASETFVAKDPEEQITQETSYIKKMGNCWQCRVLNDENKQGYAAITNDNRVIAWGWLPQDILINTANTIIPPTENIRVPFWSKYDGYLSASNATLYSPYGGDFLDEQANESNKYIITDLYWSRHAGMALVSTAGVDGGDVWVAGKNSVGTIFNNPNSNPNALVKTKHNSYILANSLAGAAHGQNTGGIILFNPNKDICNIQKYAAGVSRDIISDLTNSSDLSAEDFYYVSDGTSIRRINCYGELLSTYTNPGANVFANPAGMAMVQGTTGLNAQLNRNLLYVCDLGVTNQNKVKVFDVTNNEANNTSFVFLSSIGTGVAYAAGTAPIDGNTDGPSYPQFKNLKKIAVHPLSSHILYVTDDHTLRRLYRKDNGHWRVTTISSITNTAGTTVGTLTYTGGTTQFSNPNGVKVDEDGNIYVADQGNSRIIKIVVTDNTETSFSGTASVYVSNQFKSTASFNRPYQFAKDRDNNIYIADYANNKIRKIPYDPATTTYGSVSTFAGTGAAGVTSNANPLLAKFNGPWGITYSDATDHSLYITNHVGHQISKIDLNTNSVSIIAGSTYGFLDGISTNAKFYNPAGLSYGVISGIKYLFVADYNNYRIRRINLSNSYIVTTIGGNGTAASVLSTGAATSVKINKPVNVYYHSVTNELYFIHLYSVQKIDFSDNTIKKVAGSGVKGDSSGINAELATMGDMWGLAVSGTNMYVVDRTNYKVKQITNFTSNTPANKSVIRYAGSVNGYKDGPATTSKFGLLNGIFNNGEDLLISEDHKIRAVYSLGGVQYVKTINGTAAAGAADTTLQTKTITFAGLDIDSNGSLSYTDQAADSVGTVENGRVNELRRMSSGTLGIGDGAGGGAAGTGKSTYGFIKVKAYDEALGKVPKFKRIQFSGMVSNALLFAALDTEDSLWLWGNSPDGAFGTGQMNTIGPTKLYAFENNILDFQITCSTFNSPNYVSLISIITKDNKLYSAGDNTFGQLGRNVAASNADNNSASSFKVFKQCRTDSGLVTDARKLIVSNETGFKNNLYISVSNEVWACGDHLNGVLGRGAVTALTTTFSKITDLSDVAYLMGVANGNSSNFANQIVFALKNNGELYAWGYNGTTNGQCLTNDDASPIVNSPQPCYNYEIKDVVKNAKYIFSNDNLAANKSTVAYLDDKGDLYIGGYSTSTNVPDLTPVNIPYFRKFNMRKISPDVNLVGADAVIHRQNGTVYKIDNFGSRKLF